MLNRTVARYAGAAAALRRPRSTGASQRRTLIPLCEQCVQPVNKPFAHERSEATRRNSPTVTYVRLAQITVLPRQSGARCRFAPSPRLRATQFTAAARLSDTLP